LSPAHDEKMLLGTWSEEMLDELIAGSAQVADIGARIALLSGRFLGTPYKESTLIGDAKIPETLVINLETFDCFTFLDCVEAMRLSRSFVDFYRNLIHVRYKEGIVRYESRNHFFTDWLLYNRDFVQDKTKEIGGSGCRNVQKRLNVRGDGMTFLPGIVPVERELIYIPSADIDNRILTALKPGDYIGIYSDSQGLDVSHVGIIIRDGTDIYFRHASSAAAARRVIDEDFSGYISGKPGIIIIRPY
jgi:hypothetical protein